MDDERYETFDDFKASFSYGSRNDLSFKFLTRLDAADAAEFFRLLLLEVGELMDGADSDRLLDLVYEWQVAAYQPPVHEDRPFTYEDRPFTQLPGELRELTVGLVTSSGHYVAGEDPRPFGIEDMTQEESIRRIDDFMRSVPELTAIPRDTSTADLLVRHPGYDIRSVARDPGVAFPRSVLVEAEHAGRIGALAGTLYSFVGAVAQGRLRKVIPNWIERWKNDGVQALLLVPV